MPVQYNKIYRSFTLPRSKTEANVFNPKLSCILCNEKLNSNVTEHNCNVRQEDNAKTIVIKGPK